MKELLFKAKELLFLIALKKGNKKEAVTITVEL